MTDTEKLNSETVNAGISGSEKVKMNQNIKEKIKEKMPVLIIWLLILFCIFLFLFNRMVIIVGAGEGAVFYRLFFGGTVTTRVYGEGIHFIYPWDKLNVYNVRFQQVPHNFYVLTKHGLKVELFISIRYRPEYKLLGILHKNVGPDYLNTVVIPEIENVLRVLIGRLDAEEVYMTKESLIEKALNDAIEQIAQRFIEVDNVIIKKIVLPPVVESAIQAKIEQQHKSDEYEFKLEKETREKERKRIEAEGLTLFHKSLTPEVLHWMAIQATLKLAESANAKTIIIGNKESGLPIIGSLPLDQLSDSAQPEPILNKESLPTAENAPEIPKDSAPAVSPKTFDPTDFPKGKSKAPESPKDFDPADFPKDKALSPESPKALDPADFPKDKPKAPKSPK